MKNSIVANSTAGGNCLNNSYDSTFTALGANLDTDGTCGFTTVTSVQLNLGPLALNWLGTTATLALLPGSVTIDAVTDCTDVSGDPVTEDQRGVPRPDGGAPVHSLGLRHTGQTGTPLRWGFCF